MQEADLSAKRGCMADLTAYWRGLRKFYNPRGRATRTELFMLLILNGLLFTCLEVISRHLLSRDADHAVSSILQALFLVPIPAATARRFHDMGKSGWFALPIFILCAVKLWNIWLDYLAGPFAFNSVFDNAPTLGLFYGMIGLMFAIILMQPPRNARNPYGPDPRPDPKQI